ncbi:MAG: AI-2E family transporter, partial [Pseudomonadota bacterium]|nr:AI-2E family transporter [Pseudomonadota bacterium]
MQTAHAQSQFDPGEGGVLLPGPRRNDQFENEMDQEVVADVGGAPALAVPKSDPPPAAAAPGPPSSDSELAKVMLHMPVGIRSLSLAILAVLASVFALQWAKAVVIPILLGLMFSYALTPIVDRLARWRVPRVAGAGLVIIAIIVGLLWGGWSMRDDADAFIESLPSISLKLRQIVQRPGARQVGTIARMQQAATEISRAAEGGPAASASAPPASPTRVAGRGGAITTTTTTVQTMQPAATRVVVEQSPLNISSYLWTGTVGLFSFLGQTAIVLLVTFFLLATGNTFRRKMVKLAGPKFSQK